MIHRRTGPAAHVPAETSRRFRRGAALAVLVAAVTATGAESALAEWPPPITATAADMANPDNWPSDEAYAPIAGSPNERRSGQWPFFSFIPERSPGAPPVREGESAAGMSIDLAWRHTIGRDEVLIAVLDSGLLWTDVIIQDVDLTLGLENKAYLNRAELAPFMPQDAAGMPCGGTGDLMGFDCNGDGIFDVRDYADSPNLPDTGAVRGDINGNGLLDPSDLIIAFSDGTDDDGNGYVDDISGWDFYKNDNDPWDDTEFTHGTQEANWAAAQTDDGMGDAGVCPLCRFLPIRVGDSFIVDAHDYAKAVVYSVDSGATIVQEALGTIDMTRFTQQTMDYAWENGVLVVASMADENSRHHNFPVTANHTLPVHAITLQSVAEDATSATSFLAFNNCTNFGAQNFLSASGVACSSEAAGRLGGIAGLVYSMAASEGIDPPLTPDEAAQIILMTAQDIDIPESREPDSQFRWSQPGFDQRFGYGRVDANAAVEWVRDRKIPPEVDVTAPAWFDVLYRDQVQGTVPIIGRVAARRADSYDVIVEWAPGVQPLDDQFVEIVRMENLPPDMELGADGTPLAELDLQSIDTTHEQDIDSPFGENDRTITVRVRSIAHYSDPVGDVPGELRRAYYVTEDPDLLPGFPYFLGDSLESSPKLADIDDDGVRDIVQAASGGELHVLTLASGRPEEMAGFPFRAKRLDGLDGDASRTDYLQSAGYANGGVDLDLARETFTATPAVADIDGDGRMEIAATTTHGTVYVINHDGSVADGWPQRLPDIPSCPLDRDHVGELCMGVEQRGTPDALLKGIARGAFASPVLEDMNGDGDFEIIQAAFDGFVHIFEPDGSPLSGWPVRIHNEGAEFSRILTTPAVGDFNGDGTPDVLVGSNERLGQGGAGAFFLVDGRGTNAGNPPYFPNWPVSMTSFQLFPVIAEGVTISPIIASVEEGDGPNAIMHGNASAPLILPLDPGTQATLGSTPTNALPERVDEFTGEPSRGLAPTSLFGAQSEARTPDTMFPLFGQPSAGDLNQDGTPDIITSGGSLSLAQNLLSSISQGGNAQQLLSMWDGETGSMFPGSPVPLEDFTFFVNHAIADVSGDGYPEVITGTGGYFLRAVDACGREAEGFKKFTGQWIIATAAVGDITNDENLEVVVGTRSGYLYAWRTNGRTDGVIQWESFHHDNRNTGNYSVPLEQGTLLGDQGPLAVDEDGLCVTGPTEDGDSGGGGGCGCRTAGARTASSLMLLGVGLFGTMVFWRRRRSRRRA